LENKNPSQNVERGKGQRKGGNEKEKRRRGKKKKKKGIKLQQRKVTEWRGEWGGGGLGGCGGKKRKKSAKTELERLPSKKPQMDSRGA